MPVSIKDRDKIFKKFVQLEHPMTKTQAGIGLGLSLSKELAKMLGGDIWFVSPGKNKGSTFFFALPVKNNK